MRYPWANTLLLVLVLLQLATGLGGLTGGTEGLGWLLWLHSLAGYALAILLGWKGLIIWNVLKRPWQGRYGQRLAFSGLVLLLLAVLATGWVWTSAGQTYLLGFSLVVLHGLLACSLLGLLAWHTFARWYVWRAPMAHGRRAALYLGGLSLAGLALRQVIEPAKALVELPGAARRFTGSYETGSFSGLFPATSWWSDRPEPVDPASWRLVIDGMVERPLSLSYAQLVALAQETRPALLDCTGGFYTEQAWTGPVLADLLALAGVKSVARSLTVEAGTGYGRRFPLSVATYCLLATHVAGQPLSHSHGFPIRLVAPGYRGYDWVKWVTRLRVNDSSYLWQPPLPLQ